jgi:hypothetical protein
MRKSLLSHIAGSFISQYENVANSSIAYLLNNYSQARIALEKSLELKPVQSIRFITELGNGENGRPDVTGIDITGSKIFIIEGKFWASLTSNQPNNYINELSPDGKILFLSPEKRKDSLCLEINKRIGPSGCQNLISVFSWKEFIEKIEHENTKDPNIYLTSDLSQLKALCERMDIEGMPPLSASDLDPMNGRISYQLADLLDDCREVMINWPETDFKGVRAVANKSGYGFYFKMHGFGCQLMFSTFHWFTTKSSTPYWLSIGNSDFKRDDSIVNILSHKDSDNAYDDQPTATYGIVLNPGMDKTETVLHITNKVKEVLNYIKENIP